MVWTRLVRCPSLCGRVPQAQTGAVVAGRAANPASRRRANPPQALQDAGFRGAQVKHRLVPKPQCQRAQIVLQRSQHGGERAITSSDNS
jgi:hypothetical protein